MHTGENTWQASSSKMGEKRVGPVEQMFLNLQSFSLFHYRPCESDHQIIMEVGSHCSFKACKQIDFLPYKCQECLAVFCTDHHHPWDHECAPYENKNSINSNVDPAEQHLVSSTTSTFQTDLEQARKTAAANDIIKNSLNVEKQDQLKQRQKSALDFVRQNLPSASSKSKQTTTKSTYSSSARQKLMYLRRTAVALDPNSSSSVPVLNRVYFSTAYIHSKETITSNNIAETKAVWSDPVCEYLLILTKVHVT